MIFMKLPVAEDLSASQKLNPNIQELILTILFQSYCYAAAGFWHICQQSYFICMAPDLSLGERPGMFLGAGQVTSFSNIHSLLWGQLWAFHTWDDKDKGRFIYVVSLTDFCLNIKTLRFFRLRRQRQPTMAIFLLGIGRTMLPKREVRSEPSSLSFRNNSYLSTAHPYKAESIHTNKLLSMPRISFSQRKQDQGCSC